MLPSWGKVSLQIMIKNCEMRTLSWIICVGPRRHHKCPSKKVAEERREESQVTTEAEPGATWPVAEEYP